MQLTATEQAVVKNMHDLPLNKQQSILDFSLFLKNEALFKENSQHENHKNLEEKSSAFLIAFKKFLKENAEDPLDIDTSIFDRDRALVKEREINLWD